VKVKVLCVLQGSARDVQQFGRIPGHAAGHAAGQPWWHADDQLRVSCCFTSARKLSFQNKTLLYESVEFNGPCLTQLEVTCTKTGSRWGLPGFCDCYSAVSSPVTRAKPFPVQCYAVWLLRYCCKICCNCWEVDCYMGYIVHGSKIWLT